MGSCCSSTPLPQVTAVRPKPPPPAPAPAPPPKIRVTMTLSALQMAVVETMKTIDLEQANAAADKFNFKVVCSRAARYIWVHQVDFDAFAKGLDDPEQKVFNRVRYSRGHGREIDSYKIYKDGETTYKGTLCLFVGTPYQDIYDMIFCHLEVEYQGPKSGGDAVSEEAPDVLIHHWMRKQMLAVGEEEYHKDDGIIIAKGCVGRITPKLSSLLPSIQEKHVPNIEEKHVPNIEEKHLDDETTKCVQPVPYVV